MDFLEKLDFLMHRFDLTKTTLSQKSGIPYTTIDAWYKKGYEGLKLTTLRKLAQYFNTSLDYWCEDEITDPNYGRSHGFKVEYNEMEHIKKYRFISEHSPDGAKVVDTVLDREYSIAEQLKQAASTIVEMPAANDAVRLIEYYRSVSAGTGQVIFEDVYHDRITIPDDPKYKRAAYAVKVNGHSMEPTYSDGDMLLIEPTCEVDVGEVGIFNVGGQAYVKELGHGELISLNKEYKNVTLTEESSCMGRVVDKL